jgi:hypothetical protein
MRALLLLASLCIAVFVMSVVRPEQPVSAQQGPLNELQIGNVKLSGDFWDVLNLQGVPASVGIALIPKERYRRP